MYAPFFWHPGNPAEAGYNCRMMIGQYSVAQSRRISVVVFFSVSLVLLLQSLAPPGYMAGSVKNGWPVVLCPEGLPAGFFGHAQHHHNQEESGSHDQSLGAHCPLGSVLDASATFSIFFPGDPIEQKGSTHNLHYRSAFSQPQRRSDPVRAPPVLI